MIRHEFFKKYTMKYLKYLFIGLFIGLLLGCDDGDDRGGGKGFIGEMFMAGEETLKHYEIL